MTDSLGEMKSNQIKPIDRVIKTTFSEKGGAAAVRLPPAKRNEWKWTADVLHQTSHEITNVERIRYIFIKQSLEDDEIKPRIKSYNINHRFSRRYEIQTNPKSYKTNILRERRRRSRKTSTSEAERVKMDGGCSKPNQAMTIANVERIRFEY